MKGAGILRENLKNFVRHREWHEVVVRDIEWIETIGGSLTVPKEVYMIDVFEVFFQADPYIANARAEYILTEQVDLDRLAELIIKDPYTRRAYTITPDWWWSDHDPCIMATQFLYRDGKLMAIVFIRSSNLYRALPYDIYATRTMQVELIKKLKDLDTEARFNNIEVGDIIFQFGSAHVFKFDWEDFLNMLGLKEADRIKH